VKVTVRPDLVSRAADLLDETRITGRHPSKDEERGADVTPIEEIEQISGVLDDAGRQLVPALGRERAARAAHMKPFFDVDGEAIVHGAVSGPPPDRSG
jgi:hypothetical protein